MIFTLNEEVNLPSCLDSLAWCDDVIVVDSFSTDRTEAVCRERGVTFHRHAFEGFGSQRNWALDQCETKHLWVLILDADEKVPVELADELREVLRDVPDTVGAYRLKRRFYMWGRWLKYSSLYPSWVVRLVRKGKVRYANRGHAETQEVDGDVRDLKCDLIDENLKGIEEWFERQNRYSSREAEYELNEGQGGLRLAECASSDPLTRRAALKRLAAALPARGLLYFLYGYVLRLGFLDGRDGFVFCRMRAMYQSEIAAKKYDLRRRARR